MPAQIGNKYALGNSGGRPPHYATPEDLAREVDAYFEYIKGEWHEEEREEYDEEKEKMKRYKVQVWNRHPEPCTITGLTLYLGFCDRASFYDYGKKEEFFHIIKNARTRVEHGYELGLHNDKPTGAIFALKNMGWEDKKQLDHNLPDVVKIKIGGKTIER